MPIKELVEKLKLEYRCSDPMQIANDMGMIIIHTPLVGIRGFYQYLHRCHIIYLDSSLNDQERMFVCAHELGHALMHKGINRIFLDTRTFAVSSRYEKEADQFAACLLYSSLIEDWEECTSYQIAAGLDISVETAEWLLKQ